MPEALALFTRAFKHIYKKSAAVPVGKSVIERLTGLKESVYYSKMILPRSKISLLDTFAPTTSHKQVAAYA